MTVLNIHTGQELRWDQPQRPTKRVKWDHTTTSGGIVQGSLRTISHLDWMSARAEKLFRQRVFVIQGPYNTTVPASKGTHDFDACMDLYIPGLDWWKQQRFFRAHGLGCWYRHAPLFGNHIHGFTLPTDRKFKTEVGLYVDGGITQFGRQIASSQIDDYYAHAFGLSGMHNPGSDHSWFPKNIDGTVFDLANFVGNKRHGHQR